MENLLIQFKEGKISSDQVMAPFKEECEDLCAFLEKKHHYEVCCLLQRLLDEFKDKEISCRCIQAKLYETDKIFNKTIKRLADSQEIFFEILHRVIDPYHDHRSMDDIMDEVFEDFQKGKTKMEDILRCFERISKQRKLVRDSYSK